MSDFEFLVVDLAEVDDGEQQVCFETHTDVEPERMCADDFEKDFFKIDQPVQLIKYHAYDTIGNMMWTQITNPTVVLKSRILTNALPDFSCRKYKSCCL